MSINADAPEADGSDCPTNHGTTSIQQLTKDRLTYVSSGCKIAADEFSLILFGWEKSVMTQSKKQETIGAAAFVVVCLILLGGCQDDQSTVQQPKSSPISNKSEKVKQEERQKYERCRKAAELGDAVEQNNLGIMYANGEGVEQDNTLAVVWFRKSAEQGNAVAQFNLGIMYLNGEGVKQDDTQGYEWLNKSYRQLKKQNKL